VISAIAVFLYYLRPILTHNRSLHYASVIANIQHIGNHYNGYNLYGGVCIYPSEKHFYQNSRVISYRYPTVAYDEIVYKTINYVYTDIRQYSCELLCFFLSNAQHYIGLAMNIFSDFLYCELHIFVRRALSLCPPSHVQRMIFIFIMLVYYLHIRPQISKKNIRTINL